MVSRLVEQHIRCLMHTDTFSSLGRPTATTCVKSLRSWILYRWHSPTKPTAVCSAAHHVVLIRYGRVESASSSYKWRIFALVSMVHMGDAGAARRVVQEEFLSLPKTPMELLIFCRKNLELNLPGDPVGSGDDKKSTDGDSWRNSADDIDDERAADDVARMVLSWGAPFRKIDTRWRVPVSSRVLTVASEATRGDEPLIGNVVLCSSREIARGASHPILEPGTSGPSFTVDFSAEDVRWLKDQWN